VQAEVVVLRLGGVRVGDRVVPKTEIVRRQSRVVDWVIGQVSASELNRWPR
jgi:hypothetical protein